MGEWLRMVAARFHFKHHGWGEPRDRKVDHSQLQEDDRVKEALEYMGAGVMERPWHHSTDKPVLFVNIARKTYDLPQI